MTITQYFVNLKKKRTFSSIHTRFSPTKYANHNADLEDLAASKIHDGVYQVLFLFSRAFDAVNRY